MLLVEKNARILAEIDPEWADLGSLRQINFAIRFNDYSEQEDGALPVQEQVAKFLAFAEQEGCETLVVWDENGGASVRVSKIMAPTAENVTFLQERLTFFTDEYPRAYVDGWHYPPKRTVVFWPNGSEEDIRLARNRAEILFDGKLVNDPLQTGKIHQESEIGRVARDPSSAFRLLATHAQKTEKQFTDTFKLVPSDFLRLAASKAPRNPEPTVSGFSQWVYSLYSNDLGSDDDRTDGKQAEKEIWRRKDEAFTCNDSKYLKNAHSPWKLIHNGLHLDQHNSRNFFELPEMRVNGKALRASPDLIYSNNSSSEAIIVEIKYTRMTIPKNLWPNVWAQLWCYAQIDRVAHLQRLTVVGEVWGEMFSRGYGRGRNRVDGKKLICLRASVRRDPRALPYDRFFRQLFQIYSGA